MVTLKKDFIRKTARIYFNETERPTNTFLESFLTLSHKTHYIFQVTVSLSEHVQMRSRKLRNLKKNKKNFWAAFLIVFHAGTSAAWFDLTTEYNVFALLKISN